MQVCFKEALEAYRAENPFMPSFLYSSVYHLIKKFVEDESEILFDRALLPLLKELITLDISRDSSDWKMLSRAFFPEDEFNPDDVRTIQAIKGFFYTLKKHNESGELTTENVEYYYQESKKRCVVFSAKQLFHKLEGYGIEIEPIESAIPIFSQEPTIKSEKKRHYMDRRALSHLLSSCSEAFLKLNYKKLFSFLKESDPSKEYFWRGIFLLNEFNLLNDKTVKDVVDIVENGYIASFYEVQSYARNAVCVAKFLRKYSGCFTEEEKEQFHETRASIFQVMKQYILSFSPKARTGQALADFLEENQDIFESELPIPDFFEYQPIRIKIRRFLLNNKHCLFGDHLCQLLLQCLEHNEPCIFRIFEPLLLNSEEDPTISVSLEKLCGSFINDDDNYRTIFNTLYELLMAPYYPKHHFLDSYRFPPEHEKIIAWVLNKDFCAAYNAIPQALQVRPDFHRALMAQTHATVIEFLGRFADDIPHHSDHRQPVINYAQSVHNRHVHRTASESAKKLMARYYKVLKIQSVNSILSKIEAWLKEVRVSDFDKDSNIEEAHLRAARDFSPIHYTDPVSRISNAEMFALVWLAIHDDAKRVGTLKAALGKFVKTLYETQRTYNLDESGHDTGKADASSCASGTFVNLVNLLNGVDPDVRIVFISKETATLKLPKVVKAVAHEYLASNPTMLPAVEAEGVEAIWQVIREEVKKRLQEEFPDILSDAAIEAGIYADVGSLPVAKESKIDKSRSHSVTEAGMFGSSAASHSAAGGGGARPREICEQCFDSKDINQSIDNFIRALSIEPDPRIVEEVRERLVGDSRYESLRGHERWEELLTRLTSAAASHARLP